MTDSPRNLGDVMGDRRLSDEVAIVSVDADEGVREWRCHEIEAGTLAYADLLQRRGIEPGSTVGLFSKNSVHNLMAYQGIMRAGCVCVPVNIRQPAGIIRYICDDAQIRFAFTDGTARSPIREGIEQVRLGSLEAEADAPPLPRVDEQSTALILYTSGSTGRPKGVVLSHFSQLSMIDAVTGGTESRLFAGQRGIVVAPMFHMNALVFIASFLKGGGSLVLMPKFDAARFADAIGTYGVNVITGVPTMIAMLHAAWRDIGKPVFAEVNTVYIGSAPVTRAIVEQSLEMMPNAQVLNSYGTTETGGGLFGPHPDGLERPPTSVGYPGVHVELLLDGDGALVVRAPSMMSRYLNLPDLTASRLRDGWFNTGDLFERDENGFFFFKGRADDMFVCSGENIYPGEVEQAIESSTKVVQAAVVPVPDAIRGQMPVAFVVAADGKVSERDVQDHVRSNAAPYLYPRRVWFVDALPLASTTKIDRRELMHRAEALVAADGNPSKKRGDTR
ncbi:MAG: class I adenylate-forming enzyme family protein [Gammaproteobacteria bacterium]|nr:class I adenylate-forming enzyme family protein [Gammaproteobacteria bacterium]